MFCKACHRFEQGLTIPSVVREVYQVRPTILYMLILVTSCELHCDWLQGSDVTRNPPHHAVPLHAARLTNSERHMSLQCMPRVWEARSDTADCEVAWEAARASWLAALVRTSVLWNKACVLTTPGNGP